MHEHEDSNDPSSSLDKQIADRLRRELSDRGPDASTDAALAGARAVLYDPELSAAEAEAIAKYALESSVDPVPLLLGLRIERALRVGLEAASGEGDPAPSTEVLVVRAPSVGSKRERERDLALALQRISKRIAERLRGGHGHLLLLATRQVYDKVQRLLPSQDKPGMPTLVYHDEDSISTGFTPTASIEITHSDVALPDYERHVSERVEQVRKDSVELAPGDEGKAPPLPAAATPSTPAPAKKSARDEQEDPLVGELFHGKYRIVQRIGRGGFGSVYEGTDERGAGNRVAIKVLSGAAAESAITQQSFKDEARRVTRLSHPNIVDWKVFDEDDEGVPYFVMELVEGEEFGDTLRREQRIEPRRAARLLLQALDALRAAHHLSARESILHLDFKPNNLFLVPGRHGREEQIKVIDFGIGQYIGDEQAPDAAASQGTESDAQPTLDVGPSTLTFAPRPGSGGSSPVSSGSVTGGSNVIRSLGCTPEFASPEQCAHVMHEEQILALDGRSDLYSLGVVAFRMLTGRLPFIAPKEHRLDVLRMHREETPPTLASLGVKVPRKLAYFVERCLRKDRDERWRDTQEAYEYLRDFVHPPVGRAIAKVVVPLVLVGGVLGVWLWSQRDLGVPLAGLVDGSGADLSSAGLYLGPQRASVLLGLGAVEGEAPSLDSGTWRLVDAANGEPIGGFEVERGDGGAVALRATDAAATGRRAWTAELRLEPDLLRSKGFDLVWLGADCWSIASLEVAGTEVNGDAAIPLDPEGAALDVWVGGPGRADLARVGARVGNADPLSLPRGQSTADRTRYRLDLTDVGLATGPQSVELELLDRAGGRQARTLQLDALAGPLALTRAELANWREGDERAPALHRAAGRFVVSPRANAAIAVDLPRTADLEWSVHLDGAAEPELRGELEGQQSSLIELPGLADLRSGEAYAGSVRVAAREDAYVRRPSGSTRGRAEAVLPFVFEPSEPRFATRWIGATSELTLDADTDGAHYTNVAAGALQVVREEPVPMRVEVAWWPAGELDAARVIPVDELRNVQANAASVPLELPADGAYVLRVRSWRYESSAVARDEEPEVEQQFELVLDRHAPGLAMSGLAAGALITPERPAPTSLSISFLDLGQGEPAGVEVEVELRRIEPPDGPSIPYVLSGVDAGGAELVLALEDPWSGLGADGDGHYECTVSGRDRAGNEFAGSRVEFDVALHGPELELQAPTGVGKWHPDRSDGRWRVVLRASDPNGVDAVLCELVTAPDAAEGIEVKLDPEVGSTAIEQVQAGALVLPHELSDARIWLRSRARDAFGTERTWTSPPFVLPSIAAARPERVVARVADGTPGTMRFVSGNEGYSYLFGGRGDGIENAEFLRAGLSPFNPAPRRSRSRSWQIEFAAGQIGDYYLAEREVSTAEYLAFLHAQGGWRDPANWPVEATPDEVRRTALVEAFEARAPDLPATGLTWQEANAYALWTGCSLPTWVEWEYAVRGGADYRPFSAFDAEDQDGAPVRSGVRACGEGNDWTPGGGFADLCTNAAEWTATGFARSSEVDDRYPHLWAVAHRETLLERDAGAAERYWVVGGAVTSSGFVDGGRTDFAVADVLPRALALPELGFRCAASLETVRERLGQPTTDGTPWFEEVAQ